MTNTTLCYLEKDGAYLMMHRVKKKNDENEGKWVGVGGHFLDGESPEECLKREVLEETGFTLNSFRYRGIVTFVSDRYGTEYMHLFTSQDFSGTLTECDEGDFAWIPVQDVLKLNLWEGDPYFLRLLVTDEPFFSLKLSYKGDALTAATLNGNPLPISVN